MKIIFLNCWLGEKRKELLNYISKKETETYIYCFQEFTKDLRRELKKVINSYFSYVEFKEFWKDFKYGKGIYFKKQYFADFVFVSPEIKVIDFKVPNLQVSDHNPMILEFDV